MGYTVQTALHFDMEWMLSDKIRPFLRSRGFTKSGRTFRRSRAPLWDTVNFQSNRHNRVTQHYGFFVNIGVGSAEIDTAQRNLGVRARPLPIFDRRWEDVVADLPYEVRFDNLTELGMFADQLCEDLARTLAVTETFTNTDELVRWAIAYNKLHRMEPVCSYLAATGDFESLEQYVHSLRDQFGHQDRWAIFNRQLIEATGPHSRLLMDRGILDEPSTVDDLEDWFNR